MNQMNADLQDHSALSSSGIADADSPLVRDCWYVAAHSEELGDQLSERWLLGVNVLLYRTSDGRAVALDNRCPHRSFPLSRGRRDADNIVCGYHGMTFDSSGACLRLPANATGRATLKLRSFPICERAPLVWIWMGDPERADVTKIPDYFPLTAQGWVGGGGYYHVKANYLGLHENLQDLSHFEYLHSTSIGVPDQTPATIEVQQSVDAIRSVCTYSDVPAPPLWSKLIALAGDRVTRTIRETFKSPALCDAHTTITDLAARADGTRDYDLRIYHFITPESHHTTHYWWHLMRDFTIDSDEVTAMLHSGIAKAFEEDRQALEWISELARGDRTRQFRELSFPSDRAAVFMRRRIYKMTARAE
jgi:phenylpropionate dioxygenase-like ring-hydroxylating dioxygenase large terminal subunit